MHKTIIVLPNGSEIASGDVDKDAVISCTITRKVNVGNDLTLGSTCAAMAEIDFILRSGMSPVAAGDEINIYKLAGSVRTLLGVFICEKPKVTNDRKLTVTAYDRITRLDKNLTGWLRGLNDWPYSLLDFSRMVCQQCGLVFSSVIFPNSQYMVKKFQASDVTGRDLIQWAAQAAASFCRATTEGNIEFSWYTPASMDIGASDYDCKVYTGYNLETGNVIVDSDCITPEYALGNLTIQTGLLTSTFSNGELSVVSQNMGKKIPCCLGTFKRQDYKTEPIDQIQIQYSSADLGVKYPEGAGENVYKITGNFLLMAETAQQLTSVAQNIYDRLKTVTYTPLKIAIPTDNNITAGKTVKIISKDGTAVTAYIMTAKDTGTKCFITSEGSRNRNSVTAINNRKFGALTGKYLEIHSNIEGVNVKIGNTNKAVTELDAKADGISVRVTQVEQTAAENLRNFSDAVNREFDKIQNQLDGVIDTWYGEEIPTQYNTPAVDWVTSQDKEKHSGDLYYVVGDGSDSGNAYRWIFLNGMWYWDKLANSDIAKALKAAADAQDTADGKRRVFVSTPHTPYDLGDLWSESDKPLMRCSTGRESGAFQASDWGYADNAQSQLNEQKEITTKLINKDEKIEASVTEVRETADSALKQAAAAVVTADAVTLEVKNIQIGSTNLLRGSEKMENFPHNSAGAASEGTYTYTESNSVIVTNNSSNSCVVMPTPVLTHNRNYVFGVLFRMLGGEETVNFGWQGYQTDGTPTGDRFIYHLHRGNISVLPPALYDDMGDGWIRVYFPVYITYAETVKTEIIIRGGTFGSEYFNQYEISHPTLVNGTKPAAWSPSPKDMEAHFEIRAKEIDAEVKKKVNFSEGAWDTFGWELQSDRWELRANSQTVFKVTKDGAYVAGEIQAKSGKIGEWDIDTGLASNGATWQDSRNGMYIGPDGIAFGTSFWVSPDGYLNADRGKFKGSLEAATGSFSGKVTAESGKIGPWVVDGTSIYYQDFANDKNLVMSSVFGLYGGNNQNGWYIRLNGEAYFSNATIKGTIEAENGYFHGTIRAGKIEYGPDSGYVPKAGLDKTARDELGYADFSNQVFNGMAQAQNIGTNVLKVVSNMFFRGEQVGVKRIAGQNVLVVLPKENSIEEVNR